MHRAIINSTTRVNPRGAIKSSQKRPNDHGVVDYLSRIKLTNTGTYCGAGMCRVNGVPTFVMGSSVPRVLIRSVPLYESKYGQGTVSRLLSTAYRGLRGQLFLSGAKTRPLSRLTGTFPFIAHGQTERPRAFCPTFAVRDCSRTT